MGDMIDINIEGQEDLINKLERIADKIKPEELLPILFEAAQNLQSQVKARTSIGPTGNLQRSIISKKLAIKPPYPTAALVAGDRKIAPHFHLVEYGHGGPHPAGPHPFFWPTVQGQNTSVTQWIFNKIQSIVNGEVES